MSDEVKVGGRTRSVGILTFHRALNYGAVLQAFALQTSIERLGHRCQIIDYVCRLSAGSYSFFRSGFSREAALWNYHALVNLPGNWQLRKRFSDFSGSRLALTQRAPSIDSVEILASDFDVIVAGSDQVWNPTIVDAPSQKAYFLDFPTPARRVAYAPSFGVTNLPEPFRLTAAARLSRFDFLSCRENLACSLVESLTGRRPAHVVDPTLLLSAGEYEGIAISPKISRNYLLLYALELSDSIFRLARSLADTLGMRLVALVPVYYQPRHYSYTDEIVFGAGPAEFLGWLKEASFVCTNSFHGTVFSCIFRKNFVSMAHSRTNTRSSDFLERCGLASRQVSASHLFGPDDPLLAPIDYSTVDTCLRDEVSGSLCYLREALE